MKEPMSSAARLGEELKKLREDRMLGTEAVSARLKIQGNYIYAIEEGRLEALPSSFYRKSFIKEYCLLLGATDVWDGYLKLFAEEEQRIVVAEQDSPMPARTENEFVRDKEYKRENNKPLLVCATIVLLLGIAAACVFRSETQSVSKDEKVMQLAGGTKVIVEQKKAEEKQKEKLAEEKAKKLAEERAKAEEAQLSDESAVSAETATNGQEEAPAETTPAALAKNEIYIAAPTQEVSIKVSQAGTVLYDGKIAQGKSMRFKVEGEKPVRVRYENPNLTEVTYGGTEFKPLHPSGSGRSRYYWNDGTVTFTGKR